MGIPSLRIHGPLKATSDDGEIAGLELELIAGSPLSRNQGRLWFDTIAARPALVTSPNNAAQVSRKLAFLDELPATPLQVIRGLVGSVSGTAIIASTATVPLVTAGTELIRKTVTLGNTGNNFEIEFNGIADCVKRNTKIFIALFRDSICVDITAVTTGAATTGSPQSFTLVARDNPPAGTPVVYSIRIGADSATTWYLGRGNTQPMGLITESYFKISEYKP